MTPSKKREISCRITRTLLLYVRENNRGSLGGLLDGLDLDEAYLLDQNNWVSHALLHVLYDRMAEILKDDNAVYNMALSADRLNSVGMLNRIARLLGSPQTIYSQAPDYNKFLKMNGDVFIRKWGGSWCLLEDRYHSSDQKHRRDCDYTRGVLTGIPTMFDMPPAFVEEIECQVSAERYGKRIWKDNPRYGAQGCLYRVQWDPKTKPSLMNRIRRRASHIKAIEDLREANRKIQDKYDEVRKLASDLQAINRELEEAKNRKESYLKDLEASESRYRLLAESISDVVWTLSLEDLRLTYVSPSVMRSRGYTPQEAINMSVEETLSPDSYRMVIAALGEELRKEREEGPDPNRIQTVNVRQICKDGSYRWGELTASFLRDKEGRPISVLGVTRDVNERLKAEENLKQNEERLRLITDHMADVVTMTDLNYTIQYASPSYMKVLGLSPEERLGKNILDRMLSDDLKSFRAAAEDIFLTGSPGKTVHRYTDGGGRLLWMETVVDVVSAENGVPKGMVFTSRDITKRKEAEKEQEDLRDQLLHAKKLEAVGTLAGGIAHDFNNLLMGIQGHTSIMLSKMGASEPFFERLRSIENLVINGSDLTKQLLGFARKGRYNVQPTDINELVSKTASLFGRTRREIVIHSDFDSNLHFVEADRGQIEQVFMNLFVNAAQAMPAGGELYLSTTNESLDRERSESQGVCPGMFVKISVRDVGIGMDEETLSRIFEPFFTTKEMGRGTGLGLASVYGIIRAHQGFIQVNSRMGEGTAFDIYLPASQKENKIDEDSAAPQIFSGEGSVLIVDDDERVINVTGEMLSVLGYRVYAAKSGAECMDLYNKFWDSIRFIILDMVMPDIGGGQIFDRLKAIDPKLKIILCSGYSINGQAKQIMERGCDAFLEKPFNMQTLSDTIRKILK
ncbi:MAG TPA: PAS domain S-box protein [Syntrophales bacterium]|nr:PAS domain S-box protein [Syntrophales bacterium]